MKGFRPQSFSNLPYPFVAVGKGIFVGPGSATLRGRSLKCTTRIIVHIPFHGQIQMPFVQWAYRMAPPRLVVQGYCTLLGTRFASIVAVVAANDKLLLAFPSTESNSSYSTRKKRYFHIAIIRLAHPAAVGRTGLIEINCPVSRFCGNVQISVYRTVP